MLVGPVFLGYAMQAAKGQWIPSLLDGYLVLFAFSLAFALLALGHGVEKKSVRKNLGWLKGFDRISLHAFRIILAVSLVLFVFWTLVLWGSYFSFKLDVIDPGIYSSIVYNSSQGQWFYNSWYQINALGEHFSPIMLVFVPLFWIYPSILWLLTAQTAAFAVCPVILFFICKEIIKNEKPAAQVAMATTLLWFAFPSLLNAVKTGFHPSTLSLPLILLGFLALIQNRLKIFWPIMISLLLFKENLALVWISFGLYSFFALKRKTLGMALILLGGLWGIAVVKWVIPFFRGGHWHHTDRLGPTQFIFMKLKYLWLYLFLPLGFLSLVNWRSSLMIWPPILLNLSVQYTKQFQGGYHYDDIIVPLLFLAAICGAASFKNLHDARRLKLSNAKYLFCWFMIPLIGAIYFPAERLIKHFPNETQWAVARELGTVQKLWPENKIHLDHRLRSHVNFRKATESLTMGWQGWKFESGDLIILVPALKGIKPNKYYNFRSYDAAMKSIEDNVGLTFKRVEGPFHYLKIYEAL